jgi:AraC family transcriptional regulator
MPKRLPRGHFYGTLQGTRQVNHIVLTETRYAPGLRLPPHSHEHAYFCLVRRGTYTETFGGRSRACGPQTVAFHPPEELHAQQMHHAEVWSFNVEISPAWLREVRRQTPTLDGPADFQGGPLAGLALRLYQEFRHADGQSPLVVEGLVLQLLGEASRLSGRREGPSNPGRTPSWVGQVREVLHARFAEPLTLGQLAGLVGLHPAYLASAFRRHCRCSVGDYVRRLRVQEACRRLAATAEPLAEIALAAGFSDQSHLTRLFKRHLGVTPAVYRESAGPP